MSMMIKSFKMAWKSIFASKMRSFLTMLGIIIGIVSLVVMVSLVDGATSSVTSEIENMGSDLLTVSINDDKGKPLRLEELSEFNSDGTIKQTAPLGQISVMSKYKDKEEIVTLYGTTASFAEIQGLKLSSGRFLKTTDVENNTYVAVVSYDVADELYGRKNIVGETVIADGRSFTIVGVLEENDSLISSMLSPLGIYVPYTVESRISGMNSISTFYVSSSEQNNSELTEITLEMMLLNRYNGDEDAFNIMNMDTISSAMTSVTETLTLLLGGIAAISLLVGGIGIMNIMLVSVTERTKEIGIRKAIGASRGSIMMQFLIEALVISLIGCAIGITLSWISLEVIALFVGESMNIVLSTDIVLLSISFSATIGIIFGLYPANTAAKKHPIEALRYEG